MAITIFHNVSISIEAETPKEAYQKLVTALGFTTYETVDYTDSRDNFETAHSTEELF